MDKQWIASGLMALGAAGLVAGVAVWPPLRRYILCAYFLGIGKIFHINFVSRELYRGWVRGFELGSPDVFVIGLLAAALFDSARQRPRFAPALLVPILLWLLMVLVSATTAEVPLYAAFGILKFLRYTVAFWSVSNAIRDEKDLQWLLWTFVACAGVQAGDAVQDYLRGVYRVRASFDHPNTLGMYLNMMLPFVFAALMNLRTRLWPLLLGVFGIGAGAVVLTLSRGSWVSLGLAVAIILPASFVLRVRPQKLAIVGLMIALAIPPGVLAVQKMLKRIAEAPASSGEARVEFNAVARWMASDRAFGIGVNNYSYGTDGPYSEPFGDGLDRGGLCHNLYFLTVGELGWGGLVALLAVFGTALVRAAWSLWKGLAEDLRSILLLGFLGSLVTVMFQSTLEWALVQTGLAMTFFGLLGVASALVRMKPGASVARWQVTVRYAAAATPLVAVPSTAAR